MPRVKSSPGTHISAHPAARLLRAEPQSDWHLIRFDGSCHGNGSDAATGRWAFHLTDPSGKTVGVNSGKSAAHPTTNNITEYEGLLNGLRHAAGTPSVCGILIEGDSELVVRVTCGRWRAKLPHIIELRNEALELLTGLAVPWCARWIPRDENEFCDSLT